ncbi:MAG: hypothetical protein DCC71_22885 [Proteobacteria bacterium]|nr:MAG: hypothetical protein DCC71_22885 [Pseudomonadota bacterium]
MSARGEAPLAVLVLLAAAFVLAAPLVGRAGHPGAADVLMGLAAGCGVLSFGVAGWATLRAARRGTRPPQGGDRS